MKIRCTQVLLLTLLLSWCFASIAVAQEPEPEPEPEPEQTSQSDNAIIEAPPELREDLEAIQANLNDRGFSDEEQANILGTVITGSQNGFEATDSAAIINALPANADQQTAANVLNAGIQAVSSGQAGPEDFGVASNGDLLVFGQRVSDAEVNEIFGNLPNGFDFDGFNMEELVGFIRDPDVDVSIDGSGVITVDVGPLGSIDACIGLPFLACHQGRAGNGGDDDPEIAKGGGTAHITAVPSGQFNGGEENRGEGQSPVAEAGGGNDGPVTASQAVAARAAETITPAAEDDMTSAEASIAAYQGSPLVLPSESREHRPYLEFAFKDTLHGGAGPEARYHSLASVHLGVDKELLKRRMPIFQPLNKIGDGFLANEALRDSYLDMYESVRSVALLTLNYLDKTVAAGLATVEQQKQMRVNNHLLKQMNWAVARLSDPSLAHIIDDNEEKIVQCLAGSRAQDFTSIRYRLNFDLCNRECGTENPAETVEAPPEADTEGNVDLGVPTGPGLVEDRYDYCVCCAQVSAQPNLATNVSLPGDTGSADNVFSVVDRLFLGSDSTARIREDESDLGEFGNTAGGNHLSRVINAAKDFKDTYGDIIVRINDPVDVDARPANGTGEGMVTQVVPPKYSPQALVAIYRNGCVINDQTCSKEQKATGICPAMFNILKTWSRANSNGQYDFIQFNQAGDEVLNDDQKARRRLFEVASRGGIPLTGGTINSFLELDSILSSGVQLPLQSDLEATFDFKAAGYHRLHHYTNMFCDASAVAFAKRVHNTNSAIFIDAMALNAAISPEHKAAMQSMVNRVHEYFSLADADLASHFPIKKILMAVETEIERNRIADHSSFNSAIWNRGINTGFSNKVQGLLGDTAQ